MGWGPTLEYNNQIICRAHTYVQYRYVPVQYSQYLLLPLRYVPASCGDWSYIRSSVDIQDIILARLPAYLAAHLNVQFNDLSPAGPVRLIFRSRSRNYQPLEILFMSLYLYCTWYCIVLYCTVLYLLYRPVLGVPDNPPPADPKGPTVDLLYLGPTVLLSVAIDPTITRARN
jgi:hypothetical protein